MESRGGRKAYAKAKWTGENGLLKLSLRSLINVKGKPVELKIAYFCDFVAARTIHQSSHDDRLVA